MTRSASHPPPGGAAGASATIVSATNDFPVPTFFPFSTPVRPLLVISGLAAKHPATISASRTAGRCVRTCHSGHRFLIDPMSPPTEVLLVFLKGYLPSHRRVTQGRTMGGARASTHRLSGATRDRSPLPIVLLPMKRNQLES